MRRACCFLVFALLLATGAHAQHVGRAALHGIVVDAETGRPLPGAHVFLAETTRGTVADASGRFALRGVPLGVQRVAASMVGYSVAASDTLLTEPRAYRLTLRLVPEVVAVGAVAVEAERDRKWPKRLRTFRQRFVGVSAGADSVRFSNPEAVRFDAAWWGKLDAHAAEPLRFENRALGYRITYFLDEFFSSGARIRWDGEPLFEELQPADSAEAARWAAARERAYRGSLRHFLRALLAGRTREGGFLVTHQRDDPFRPSGYGRERRVDPSRFVRAGEDSTHARLRFRGRLVITYLDEEAEPAFARSPYRLSGYGPATQVSMLELSDGAVTVDRAGEILEPYGAVQYGYFAFEKLADLVPKGYQPEE